MTDAWTLLAIMLALMLITAIAAIRFNLRFAGQVLTQFRKLGERYGLELTIPKRTMGGLYQRNGTLYGHYKDREMSIYPRGYGMDNTRQTDTALRMLTRSPKKLRLSLARKGMAGKLGQLGRLKIIATGNTQFDEAFTLRSNNPGAAALFDDELKQRTLQEWTAPSGFLSLHECTLTYEQMGLPRTEVERQQLETMLELCLEIASRLEAWTQ